jgi:hypothetical protein
MPPEATAIESPSAIQDLPSFGAPHMNAEPFGEQPVDGVSRFGEDLVQQLPGTPGGAPILTGFELTDRAQDAAGPVNVLVLPVSDDDVLHSHHPHRCRASRWARPHSVRSHQ